MKLNNQQINALAQEIVSQISIEIKPILDKELAIYQKKKSDLDSKLEKDVLIKSLRKVSVQIPDSKYNVNNVISYIKSHNFKELKYTPSKSIPSLENVKSRIILGTIEYEKLDELIDSVKSYYTNEKSRKN